MSEVYRRFYQGSCQLLVGNSLVATCIHCTVILNVQPLEFPANWQNDFVNRRTKGCQQVLKQL